MFLLQRGGTGLCYLYVCFTRVLVVSFVDAAKGSALSVVVCVSDCTGVLYEYISLEYRLNLDTGQTCKQEQQHPLDWDRDTS